jgi:hypothetical protein
MGKFRELGIDYVVLKKSGAMVGRTPVYSNDAYELYRTW